MGPEAVKIVIGIPTFNDSEFIDGSVENLVRTGFDDIVYLDDGSTDDTYDKLVAYKEKYPQIHIIQNKENSILTQGENKWKVVAEYCRTLNPDWIIIRATDQLLSADCFQDTKDALRKRLEFLWENPNNILVHFPVVHLWRSDYWYRVDGNWGYSANNHISASCWRNDVEWYYPEVKAGVHLGAHRPVIKDSITIEDTYSKKVSTKKRGKTITRTIRSDKKVIRINDSEVPEDFSIVVLHRGMSSHELLVRKLEQQIAYGNNDKIIKKEIHPIGNIKHFKKMAYSNGLKVADEKGLVLKKVNQCWYDYDTTSFEKPEIKSLFPILNKYNPRLAVNYNKYMGF